MPESSANGGIDWVKTLLQLCIVGSCTVGVTENFEEFCKFLSRLALISVKFTGKHSTSVHYQTGIPFDTHSTVPFLQMVLIDSWPLGPS